MVNASSIFLLGYNNHIFTIVYFLQSCTKYIQHRYHIFKFLGGDC